MERWRKLGIIAGAGVLPRRLAQAAGAPFVVRLAGIADEDFSRFDGADCGLAEAGKMLRLLKDAACDAVVLAGVVKRPDFSKLKPDWRGAALLPQVVAAAAKGTTSCAMYSISFWSRGWGSPNSSVLNCSGSCCG